MHSLYVTILGRKLVRQVLRKLSWDQLNCMNTTEGDVLQQHPLENYSKMYSLKTSQWKSTEM